MKQLKVINLFSGPGAGKSTTAAGLFYLMKTEGFSVELITEYAKDKVYDGHFGCLEDQIYIFGKQQRRLNRLVGNVEYAISDSPLPLSIIYNKDKNSILNDLVIEQFFQYYNYNFFINRVKKYQKIGRTQTEEEASLIDKQVKSLLKNNSIDYSTVDGDIEAPSKILKLFKEM